MDSKLGINKRDVPLQDGGQDKDLPQAEIKQLTQFRDGIKGSYEPAQKETKEGPGKIKQLASCFAFLCSYCFLGENGKPVNSDGHQEEVNQANRDYGFNTYASDKISLNRTIPDTRPAESVLLSLVLMQFLNGRIFTDAHIGIILASFRKLRYALSSITKGGHRFYELSIQF